jgi:uncharacterized membrane protein
VTAGRARPRWPEPATAVVLAMVLLDAVTMSWLSLARHRAFWTGRFDLGNMVQAVWSTAHGRPLEVTDVTGDQFVRLGAHVDPVLVLFAPLWWLWPSPSMLLVAQATIVALGALPAYLLGRRWLGDAWLGVAAAAIYLLYPPLQWATVTEFHPVTLAAPALMLAIWAAETRRDLVLAAALVFAVLCKEEVGLALVPFGIWIAVAHGRRLTGGIVAVGGLAWSLVAILVIIPHFSPAGASPFQDRYAHLGDGPGGVLAGVLTRPWEVADLLAEPGRLGYLVALLAPLLALPLLAPLLALGALPELAINLLSNWWPMYSFRFQYVAVIVPFLVAAAIAGLARVHDATWPPALARRPELRRRAPLVAALWVAASALLVGPVGAWSGLPIASDVRAEEFDREDRVGAMNRAIDRIPDGVPVSAGNTLAAHVSDRRHVYTFPVIRDARFVVVDRDRPFVADLPDPVVHRAALARLLASGRFAPVSDEEGVLVLRRVAP